MIAPSSFTKLQQYCGYNFLDRDNNLFVFITLIKLSNNKFFNKSRNIDFVDINFNIYIYI